MNEFTKRAEEVAFRDFIAKCVDEWQVTHPHLGCIEVLTVLEEIRFRLTEAMLKAKVGSSFKK